MTLVQAPPASPRLGQSPALLAELRRSTRPDHARVMAFVSFARRPGGWTEYREFLAIHYGWIAALDRRLQEAAATYELPFSGRRLPLLDRDLFMLAIPPEHATVEADIPAPRSRAQAIGYLYVYEGFRLGCRVLARQARALGADPERGAGFLSGLGGGTTGRAWRDLVNVLARVPLAQHAEVIASARELFERWEAWLRSPGARVAQLQGASGVHAGS